MKPAHQEQVNFIAGLLRSGTRYTEVLAQFGTKWHSIPKRTFDRRYKEAEATVQGEQQRIREQAEGKVAEKVEALKTQLMTSVDKQLYMQNAITEMQEQLLGKVKFTFLVGNKIMHSHNADVFMLPVEKQLEIRGKIKEYTAELNKMCGDYAPMKTDVQITQTPTIILPGSE